MASRARSVHGRPGPTLASKRTVSVRAPRSPGAVRRPARAAVAGGLAEHRGRAARPRRSGRACRRRTRGHGRAAATRVAALSRRGGRARGHHSDRSRTCGAELRDRHDVEQHDESRRPASRSRCCARGGSSTARASGRCLGRGLGRDGPAIGQPSEAGRASDRRARRAARRTAGTDRGSRRRTDAWPPCRPPRRCGGDRPARREQTSATPASDRHDAVDDAAEPRQPGQHAERARARACRARISRRVRSGPLTFGIIGMPARGVFVRLEQRQRPEMRRRPEEDDGEQQRGCRGVTLPVTAA